MNKGGHFHGRQSSATQVRREYYVYNVVTVCYKGASRYLPYETNSTEYMEQSEHRACVPCESLNLDNQKSRKLGVFGRKLYGSHIPSVIFIDSMIT